MPCKVLTPFFVLVCIFQRVKAVYYPWRPLNIQYTVFIILGHAVCWTITQLCYGVHRTAHRLTIHKLFMSKWNFCDRKVSLCQSIPKYIAMVDEQTRKPYTDIRIFLYIVLLHFLMKQYVVIYLIKCLTEFRLTNYLNC